MSLRANLKSILPHLPAQAKSGNKVLDRYNDDLLRALCKWADYIGQGTGSLTTEDEGIVLSNAVDTMNFVGSGVTASGAGSTTTVTIPGAGTATITIKDEGSTLSTGVNTLDFVGGGVTATGSSTTVTVSVPVETTLTVTDTATVDLTAGGTRGHAISADVKISATAGNIITAEADGIYAAASGSSGAALGFPTTRERWWNSHGDGLTTWSANGWDVNFSGTLTAVSLSTSILSTSLCQELLVADQVVAENTIAGFLSTSHFCVVEDGFVASFRVAMNAAYVTGTFRFFCGLYGGDLPLTSSFITTSSAQNVIGIGCDAADSNLSTMHNDGSGSCTKTTLGGGYPVQSTNNVYEIIFTNNAASGDVSYSITNINTAASTSGTFNSNLPSNTTFLGCCICVGSNSDGDTGVGALLVTGRTRY